MLPVSAIPSGVMSVLPTNSETESKAQAALRTCLSEHLVPPLVIIARDYLPSQQFINTLFMRTAFHGPMSCYEKHSTKRDVHDFAEDVIEVNLERWSLSYIPKDGIMGGPQLGQSLAWALFTFPKLTRFVEMTMLNEGRRGNENIRYVKDLKFYMQPILKERMNKISFIDSPIKRNEFHAGATKQNPVYDCVVDCYSTKEMTIEERVDGKNVSVATVVFKSVLDGNADYVSEFRSIPIDEYFAGSNVKPISIDQPAGLPDRVALRQQLLNQWQKSYGGPNSKNTNKKASTAVGINADTATAAAGSASTTGSKQKKQGLQS